MAEMKTESNVIFVRPNESVDGLDDAPANVWDDTLLIKAYDKAVNLAKDKVAKRLGLQSTIDLDGTPVQREDEAKKLNQENKSTKLKVPWKVGKLCSAKYTEDGQFYEAIITRVNHKLQKCEIQYCGYLNKEKKLFAELKPSAGPHVRKKQEALANHAVTDTSDVSTDGTYQSGTDQRPRTQFNSNGYTNMPPPMIKPPMQMPEPMPIPPPPPLPRRMMMMAGQSIEETEAYSAMLMSWYMNGYHTGYYEGLSRGNASKRPCLCNGYQI